MSLRVVVNVGPSCRELEEDLSSIPARARAERMRSLASMGLGWLEGRLDPPPTSRPRETVAARHADADSTGSGFMADPRIDQLIGSLAGGS